MDLDTVAHMLFQNGLPKGRLNADLTIQGISTDGSHQLKRVCLVVLRKVNLHQIIKPCLIRR